MDITTRTSGTVTILELPRVFTSDRGADELRETVRSLLQEGRRRFLVDMSVNGYIDDAGLDEIVIAYNAVRGYGGTIKLLNQSKRCCPGLNVIIKLLNLFETFHDEAAAIASFGGDEARARPAREAPR